MGGRGEKHAHPHGCVCVFFSLAYLGVILVLSVDVIVLLTECLCFDVCIPCEINCISYILNGCCI